MLKSWVFQGGRLSRGWETGEWQYTRQQVRVPQEGVGMGAPRGSDGVKWKQDKMSK